MRRVAGLLAAEMEPSAASIAKLIDEVKEENIPVIYYVELSSTRTAEIISEETGAEMLMLHSCHNVTRDDFQSGVTYVELMKRNLENLKKGLE